LNNIDTNNVDSKSHSFAYPNTTKRVEFNGINDCFFIGLWRGYFHICAEMAYQLKYRLYVFFSVDNFIKFSTHNQLPQSQKNTN